MRLLDFSRPYGEVHGLPGAVFEQDGLLYLKNGTPATDVSPIVEEPPPYNGPEINPPTVSCIEQPSEPKEEKNESLETMQWKKLKVLVESFGGEWTNRADAIAFMRGK